MLEKKGIFERDVCGAGTEVGLLSRKFHTKLYYEYTLVVIASGHYITGMLALVIL